MAQRLQPNGRASVEDAWLLDLVLGVPLGARYASPDLAAAMRAAHDAPPCLVLSGRALAGVRTLLAEQHHSVSHLERALRTRGAQSLAHADETVTEKPHAVFGAAMNDYASLARYAWPDPATPDGLPYRIRDGEVNPATYTDTYDAERLRRMADRLTLLAIAAYLLGDDAFADAAVGQVRRWFVDEATRQTPHLVFAQVIPGRTGVRGVGIVEARRYVHVFDAMRVLEHTGRVPVDVRDGFRSWVAAFAEWLETAPQPRQAGEATNNIGLWADLVRLASLRSLDRDEEARAFVRTVVAPRIVDQIAADGSLPRELERANPRSYATFTLLALQQLEAAADDGEMRLADHSHEAGRSYDNAVRWFRETLAANELGDRVAVMHAFLDARRRADAGGTAGGTEDPEHALVAGMALMHGLATEQAAAVSAAAAAERVQLESALQAERERFESALQVEGERLESALQAERERFESALEAERVRLESALEAERVRFESALEAERERADVAESMREHAVAEASARVNGLQRKLRASSRALSDLRTSSSWRLTAPLRRGRALADRAIQRAKRSATLRGVARRVRNVARRLRSVARPERSLSTPAPSAPSRPPARQPKPRDARDPLEILRAHVVPGEDTLRKAYRTSAIAREADTFALVRVIGNDLYPRHKRGQSRENLAFVLAHEPDFEGCTKAWIVNRIEDRDEEAAILELLDAHGQTYRRIAFDADDYALIGFDHASLPSPDYLSTADHTALEPAMQRRLVTALYRPKNLYVMHNNGARNAALDYAHELAKWALPWDGNGFVRVDAWNALREAVLARPHLPYFVVPMQRVDDNANLLRDDYHAHPAEEPQVVLRRDALERFDERFAYGRRPKVELFWRLGVPGPWERWNDDPWDQVRNPPSEEAGHFGVAGWVARLASGAAHLERSDLASFRDRGVVRQNAIVATIDRLDAQVHARRDEVDDDAPPTLIYAPRSLSEARAALAEATRSSSSDAVAGLLGHADAALTRGPYAVTDKTTTAPSGDARDYWHPAPYWWPNPASRDGLPYVRRDGERVPGTRMYEPSSDQYDRTRLQRVFDDTTALALAGHLTGRDELLQRGAATIRRWFLDPAHAMRPHLRYAQVRRGHAGDEGAATGIIEMKDLYYLLDAARVLRHHGASTSEDDAALRAWLETYREWLSTSRQGIAERAAANNHGTYYDLQTAAIAAYLDDGDGVRAALLRAEGRLPTQFDDDGEQPHERTRAISAHYYLFNLQGWLHLLHLGGRFGYVPRDLDAVAPFDRVGRAVGRLFTYADGTWPYEQQGPVAWERLDPIASMALRLGLAEHLPEAWRARSAADWFAAPAVLDPHDGAHPYWNLAWHAHASPQAGGEA